jgi:hypothetical protein
MKGIKNSIFWVAGIIGVMHLDAAILPPQQPDTVTIDISEDINVSSSHVESSVDPCALCKAVRTFNRVAIVRLTAQCNLRIDTVCPLCHTVPLNWALGHVSQAEFVVYIVHQQLKFLPGGAKGVFFGDTLEAAICRGRPDVTFGLLRLVKNPDTKIFFMSKALLTAADVGCASVVKDLLFPVKDTGTFIDVTNESGTTPLMIAAFRGRYLCANLLLLAGAQVNHQNKSGDTALTLALKGLVAGNGLHLDVIVLLLEAGADYKAAAVLARSLGCYEAFALCFEKALQKINHLSRPTLTLLPPQGMDTKTTTTVDVENINKIAIGSVVKVGG